MINFMVLGFTPEMFYNLIISSTWDFYLILEVAKKHTLVKKVGFSHNLKPQNNNVHVQLCFLRVSGSNPVVNVC